MKTKSIYLLFTILTLFVLTISCNKKKNDTSYYGTISGTVIEYDTSDAVASATVTLSPSGKNTYTGSDGHFEFIDLDASQYTMTVQKTGYVTNRKTVTISAGGTEVVSITLEKNQ